MSVPVHNFAGRRAVILHRSEDVRARLADRLSRLGMRAAAAETLEDPAAADIVLIDIDRAWDGQLPWPAGEARLPVIGLVGSESPGRLAWALAQEVDAYLPLSALGTVFSALVVAHETFRKKGVAREAEARRARMQSGRLDVIRAVMLLMEETGGDEALALKKLRALAMVERETVEESALRLLSAEARRGQAG